MLFVDSCGLYIAGRLSQGSRQTLMFFLWVPMRRLRQKFYPDEISLSLGVPGDLAMDIDGHGFEARMDHGYHLTTGPKLGSRWFS
jgi:hypothetical protein